MDTEMGATDTLHAGAAQAAHEPAAQAWAVAEGVSDIVIVAIDDARSLLARTEHPAHLTSKRQVRDGLRRVADVAKAAANVVASARQAALNATLADNAKKSTRLASTSLESTLRRHAELAALVESSPARLPNAAPHAHHGDPNYDHIDYRRALRALDIVLSALAADYREAGRVVSEQVATRPVSELAEGALDQMWWAYDQLHHLATAIHMAATAMYREQDAASHVRRDEADVIAQWVSNPIGPIRIRFQRHLADAQD